MAGGAAQRLGQRWHHADDGQTDASLINFPLPVTVSTHHLLPPAEPGAYTPGSFLCYKHRSVKDDSSVCNQNADKRSGCRPISVGL
jgi:hypothetical protein